MKLKFFLFVVLAFGAVSCSTTQKYEAGFDMHPLSIVQGVTDANKTRISVLYEKEKSPSDFWYKEEEAAELKKVKPYFVKSSPDQKYQIKHFLIKNLDPKKDYYFVVKDQDKVLDERHFRALDLNRKDIKLGVLSCTDESLKVKTEMWKSYLNRFADLNFFIGDNVYADKGLPLQLRYASPEQLWRKYIQTFKTLYFYHSSSLSPTYALWDDHDYGVNDGGEEYKYKKESLEIFNSFFPRGNLGKSYFQKEGAGSVFKAFGHKFIFIDNRSFREKEKAGSHIGKKQFNSVIKEVRSSKGPVFLMLGDQFFGAYHPFESYEGRHPKEFKDFLKQLSKTGKKILFISGDRHLSEIMKISDLGYSTYEITSSGMHAKVFPGAFKKAPNPRQLVGKDGAYNYTIIEFLREKKDWAYKVTSYGEKSKVHYSKKLKIGAE